MTPLNIPTLGNLSHWEVKCLRRAFLMDHCVVFQMSQSSARWSVTKPLRSSRAPMETRAGRLSLWRNVSPGWWTVRRSCSSISSTCWSNASQRKVRGNRAGLPLPRVPTCDSRYTGSIPSIQMKPVRPVLLFQRLQAQTPPEVMENCCCGCIPSIRGTSDASPFTSWTVSCCSRGRPCSWEQMSLTLICLEVRGHHITYNTRFGACTMIIPWYVFLESEKINKKIKIDKVCSSLKIMLRAGCVIFVKYIH